MYDVDKVAKQIREYKIMRDELNELIEQLQDEAKQQMTVQGVDELTGQESLPTTPRCLTPACIAGMKSRRPCARRSLYTRPSWYAAFCPSRQAHGSAPIRRLSSHPSCPPRWIWRL